MALLLAAYFNLMPMPNRLFERSRDIAVAPPLLMMKRAMQLSACWWSLLVMAPWATPMRFRSDI
ncbi:hypothetical protein BKM31_16100 [[Actinomadura] parvosata subsp. kistnae]|uniref:Uncharacterized protein n=1 Tax=[Actinomadura] parvosata subsp. kistnae TaxID=1909395 RepID=A0A1U9ZXX0_9ACTN|nr:hypothetical protein BKM31_16100 [Nonomuraea sp. ATCC 55076]